MQAYPVSTCHTIFTGPLHVAVPPHIVFLKKLKILPNNPSRQQKQFLHQQHCKYTACSWRISRFLINYFCAYRRRYPSKSSPCVMKYKSVYYQESVTTRTNGETWYHRSGIYLKLSTFKEKVISPSCPSVHQAAYLGFKLPLSNLISQSGGKPAVKYGHRHASKKCTLPSWFADRDVPNMPVEAKPWQFTNNMHGPQ